MIGLSADTRMTTTVLFCSLRIPWVEVGCGLVEGNGRIGNDPSNGLNKYGVKVLAPKIDLANSSIPHEFLEK